MRWARVDKTRPSGYLLYSVRRSLVLLEAFPKEARRTSNQVRRGSGRCPAFRVKEGESFEKRLRRFKRSVRRQEFLADLRRHTALRETERAGAAELNAAKRQDVARMKGRVTAKRVGRSSGNDGGRFPARFPAAHTSEAPSPPENYSHYRRERTRCLRQPDAAAASGRLDHRYWCSSSLRFVESIAGRTRRLRDATAFSRCGHSAVSSAQLEQGITAIAPARGTQGAPPPGGAPDVRRSSSGSRRGERLRGEELWQLRLLLDLAGMRGSGWVRRRREGGPGALQAPDPIDPLTRAHRHRGARPGRSTLGRCAPMRRAPI